MYKCGWQGCEKAYGTLNHLNAHVTMQAHGQKRTPEGRKHWIAIFFPMTFALHWILAWQILWLGGLQFWLVYNKSGHFESANTNASLASVARVNQPTGSIHLFRFD
jgi:hypothetical protein